MRAPGSRSTLSMWPTGRPTGWQRAVGTFSSVAFPEPNLNLTCWRCVFEHASVPVNANVNALSCPNLGEILQQRGDIPELEGERLPVALVALDRRRVIGHDHAVVGDFLIHAQRTHHVHVAVIWESLLELPDPAFDIPKVHVENLPALAEIPDYVIDLFAGTVKHLSYRTLAEIQPVIRILLDTDEPL